MVQALKAGWNIMEDIYERYNGISDASKIDPSKLIQFANTHGFSIFGDQQADNNYLVEGNNIFYQKSDGSIYEFNDQNGTNIQVNANSLSPDNALINSLGFGDNSLNINTLDFNGTSGSTNFKTNDGGTINETTTAESFNQDTYDCHGNDAGGSVLNDITSAINTYGKYNGNPSSLSNVFTSNDPNVIFSNQGQNESMAVVQNGNAYITKYDTSTGNVSIEQLTAANLGLPKGSTVKYSIVGGQLQYTYTLPNGSTSSGSSSSWGDPHFQYDGQTAFDFQGVDANNYKMLDNSDINMTAQFSTVNGQTSRVMTGETIDLKNAGLKIQANNDGTFEIDDENGNAIGDQTNYLLHQYSNC